MAFLGITVLLLIAMTVAANVHPEGPALVILLFWACPALFWGLLMLVGRESKAPQRVGGLLVLSIGIGLMTLFFRLL